MLHRNATAKQIINACALPSKAGNQVIICPISHGGFHMYCGMLPFQDAAAACESQGWRLAVLTDTNAINALATQAECSAVDVSAWIASYNGYAADPCMVNGVNPGYAIAGIGAPCFDLRWPVLCEEVPVVTTQVIVTTSQVLSSGTTSTTTTTTRSFPETTTGTTTTTTTTSSTSSTRTRTCSTRTTSSTCPQSSIRPIKNVRRPVRLPGQWNMLQEAQALYCPHCRDVCPFQRPGLRVIQSTVLFRGAEEECRKRGWRLADITTGTAAEAALLILQCTTPDTPLQEGGFAWIRSYDGVGGANCILAMAQQLSPETQFSPLWIYERCDEEVGERPVLCQADDDVDGGPAPTCDGGWVGGRRVVQLPATTTTTFTATTPLSTATATRTVCLCGQGGCDPSCWDSQWDTEFDNPDRDFF